MIVKLQQRPLISAESRRSPEIPTMRKPISEFPSKLITNEPGGTIGKRRVTIKRVKKDATKTIKPNIFRRFLVDRI